MKAEWILLYDIIESAIAISVGCIYYANLKKINLKTSTVKYISAVKMWDLVNILIIFFHERITFT